MEDVQFEVMEFNTDLAGLPMRDWKKTQISTVELDVLNHKNGHAEQKSVPIYVVEPQAHIIAATMPVGLLAGYAPDAVLVKAFEKNYKTPSKPKVVEGYGFVQQHGEPIELLDYVFETIFDRACEAEMNRYRHNSKNYESGRYVDYIKHGITVVLPFEEEMRTEEGLTDMAREWVSDVVVPDLESYVKYLNRKWKKQHARRAFGTYLAVEAVIKTNLRSLWHMARQRSAEFSPNGHEAEPEISSVVTQMVKEMQPYLPVFKDTLLRQIAKGYR